MRHTESVLVNAGLMFNEWVKDVQYFGEETHLTLVVQDRSEPEILREYTLVRVGKMWFTGDNMVPMSAEDQEVLKQYLLQYVAAKLSAMEVRP